MVPNQRFKATWTQFETFHTCPHRFDRTYLTKDIPRQTSEALDKGIRVHDGLEKTLGVEPHPQPAGTASPPKGPKPAEVAEHETPFELPPEVHPSWKESFEDLRKERNLKLEFRAENDIAYGKIDCLTDTTIIDYKTGKARVNDLGKRDQLRFYRWLLGPDSAATHGDLWWVEHPVKRAKLHLKIPYTNIMDRVWRARITEMWAGNYPKTENWKCAYCPVMDCEHNTSKPEDK